MRTFITGGIIVVFIFIQLMRGGDSRRIIDGDGSGYYAYLPAVFIHGTTDFTPVFEMEKSRRGLDYMGHYFHQVGEKKINKYYLGTALLMLPFFLLAWLYSFITGMPPDGYNILFQYSIALGASIYAAIGLLATKKLIELFDVGKAISLISVILVLFGTNLFYYTFLHPSHSHVYSFAAISVFLLFARRYFLYEKINDFRLAMLFFGLVILIRPTNAIALLSLPFLSGSFAVFTESLKKLFKTPKQLMLGLLLFFGVFSIQLIFNFIQTGNLLLWSYRNEGFHFNDPAILSFLFSYRKGFFVYTPLMLLIVPGMILFFQRSKFSFYTYFSFILILIYMLSSWWNWFFGDSFGMRAMVDFYPLLAIPLALIIKQFSASRWKRLIISLFLIPAVGLNLFQAYQYYAGIIHPDSMTKEKYWYVFLKADPSYRGILGSFPEPIFSGFNDSLSINYFNDMEGPSNLWTSNGVQTSKEAFSGRYLAEMSQSNVYSPTLVLMNENLIKTESELYVTVNLMYRELEKNATSDALLVYAATDRSSELSFYKTFRIKQMPDDKTLVWRNGSFGFKVPAWNSNLTQVKVYVWNIQKTVFQLDDFEVTINLISE
ncbi:MAG: hypothetical protein Q8J88_11865 [Bacteroidales bacterium]|nr:hypothetical protein [Bacteroidales bacterium]